MFSGPALVEDVEQHCLIDRVQEDQVLVGNFVRAGGFVLFELFDDVVEFFRGERGSVNGNYVSLWGELVECMLLSLRVAIGPLLLSELFGEDGCSVVYWVGFPLPYQANVPGSVSAFQLFDGLPLVSCCALCALFEVFLHPCLFVFIC